MFAALRRNKTWLWGILIIVVIISFVIFFSPDVNLKRSEGDTAIVAYMDGKPVSQGQFHQAYTEASIFYFLNNGQWPQDGHGWNAEAQAKQRLFLKDRAAKYLEIARYVCYNVKCLGRECPLSCLVKGWTSIDFLGGPIWQTP